MGRVGRILGFNHEYFTYPSVKGRFANQRFVPHRVGVIARIYRFNLSQLQTAVIRRVSQRRALREGWQLPSQGEWDR